ncbi:hypothetical protein AGMMS50256_36190 [Betaproteobacteria bacterium]|nr:hypothetical protein AGMMS50256_36190 [Betaproteobacteria bacterium]
MSQKSRAQAARHPFKLTPLALALALSLCPFTLPVLAADFTVTGGNGGKAGDDNVDAGAGADITVGGGGGGGGGVYVRDDLTPANNITGGGGSPLSAPLVSGALWTAATAPLTAAPAAVLVARGVLPAPRAEQARQAAARVVAAAVAVAVAVAVAASRPPAVGEMAAMTAAAVAVAVALHSQVMVTAAPAARAALEPAVAAVAASAARASLPVRVMEAWVATAERLRRR